MKVTLNIEDTLYQKLKQLVPNRQISKFISDAIRKELRDKEGDLIKAYEDAYNDNQRRTENQNWDAIETNN